MRYILAALLVLVTVGASGQQKPTGGTLPTPQGGMGYMRADANGGYYFSFNGGPEIDADELADRAKMLERIAALEKRVAELEKRQREEDERRLKMWKDLAKLCDSGNSLACESIGRKKP